MSKGYVHGYSSSEQDRLYKQAQILEPFVYNTIDFMEEENLLEVGCGVGAQTQILARRYPWLKITSIDHSKVQLARAKKELKGFKNVTFKLAKGESLPFTNRKFDAIYFCWVLEHNKNPLKLLKEAKRVLKRNGKIVCNEVQNASVFFEPYSPAIMQYWFAMNDFQWRTGDPFVGAKLGNLFTKMGFKDIRTQVKTLFIDNRNPTYKMRMLDYWQSLLLSTAPVLLENQMINQQMLKDVSKEFDIVRRSKDSVIYHDFVQGSARL